MEYLRSELREAAPTELADPALYPLSPLEGESASVIFEFRTSRAGETPERYAVVVGETEPNYYAVGDLTPDEIFELHLGTRFMLVMGVSQIPPGQPDDDSNYDVRKDAELIVQRAVTNARLEDVSIAAMFNVDGEKHAVIKALVNGRAVYIMGRDAPMGFSTRTEFAPHIAYRLHIGHVLRREADPEGDKPQP